MSQKIQPCSVSLEPLDKMDNTKKKSGKTSRQTTPVPQEATENVEKKIVESKGETSQAKTAVNGKPKKDKLNKNKDKSVANGVSDVALNSNGTSNANGSPLISDDSHPEVIEEEALVPNSEPDNDELFPELIYDETSDECNFDSSSPDFSPVGRSVTRRSQMKEKIVQMKEAFSLTPSKESPGSEVVSECVVKDADSAQDIGLPSTNEASPSKSESNSSKSLVKDSSYRRSARILDQYSTVANYTGNNSTQDTEVVGDITSSSRDHSPILDTSEDGSLADSCKETSQEEAVPLNYTEHLRSMKGRRSYKPLREISLRNLTVQRQRAAKEHMSTTVSSANATIGSEIHVNTILSESSTRWSPDNQSVNRKRRSSEIESPALVLSPENSENDLIDRPSKRQRIIGMITTPLKSIRDKISSSTPIIGRRTQAQVIIQNDLITSPSEIVVEGEGIQNDEQMPMDSDVVPGRVEHKWCSIM